VLARVAADDMGGTSSLGTARLAMSAELASLRSHLQATPDGHCRGVLAKAVETVDLEQLYEMRPGLR
jgi:hypothetical protein